MFTGIKSISKRDFKAVFKTKASVLTILALCVIPCLYTLINVKAIWSPYSKNYLKNIKIVVVNSDKGATINGQRINAGNTIVNKLKKNNEIGWRFSYNKNIDIKKNEYHAEIYIPQNFSQKMLSFADGNPQRADIRFIKNTKNSPMTGIITDAAFSELLSQIKTNFMNVLTRKIFSKLNMFGKRADNEKVYLAGLRQKTEMLSENFDSISGSLNDAEVGSRTLANLIKRSEITENQVHSMQYAQVGSLGNGVRNYSKALLWTPQRLIKSNIKMAKISSLLIYSELQTGLDTIDVINEAGIDEIIGNVSSQLSYEENYITNIYEYLKSVPTPQIKNIQNKLKDQKGIISKIEKEASARNYSSHAQMLAQLKYLSRLNSRSLDSLEKINKQMDRKIGYSEKYEYKKINDVQNRIEQVLENNNKIQKGTLKNTADGLDIISKSSQELASVLTLYKKSILDVGKKMDFSDNSINNMTGVLNNNPEQMGKVVSDPFVMKTEKIFPTKNFGSDFAPSYMVISIWVGCAMLISVLKTTVPKEEKWERYSIYSKYFGKMIIFNVLSIIQTLIIVNTTLFVLHVDAQSIFLLELFGIIVSLVFSTFIYSLASIFGNIGKAVTVILAALQIAASGAIYPIQLEPSLYRFVQPFFPFTYSVSSFRETIGGISIGNLLFDFVILNFIYITTLIGSALLKPKVSKLDDKFNHEFLKMGIGS